MRLPPLNALRAFEAAARHGGYIPAAAELHVTRGAISRHVKTLEAHLGCQLFLRNARGVALTEAGRRLLPALTEGFDTMARACAQAARNSGTLRLICPPATSIRWLIPRIGAFRDAHPEIEIRLTTDFHGEGGFDLAEFDLGFSVENWPRRNADLCVEPLFPLRLSPACAPGYLARHPLEVPADLASATLLHDTVARTDWADWAAAFDVPGLDPRSGDVFPNLDLAVRAAVLGSGVVMADLVLCAEELAAGTLCLPFPDRVADSPFGSICLIGPRDRWETAQVRAFRDWARRAARADQPAG